MRTKKPILLTALAALALIGVAPLVASAPAVVPEGADANMPTAITAHVRCRVAEVDGDTSTLVLVDLDTESRHVVRLDDKVKIRARSKKDFGRKKLGLADLVAGQTVKVTYLVNDGSIRKITVLERA